MIERAIKCLDRIPPYDTHKIGVIYVGPGQHDNEAAILRNVYGSSRYMTFLAGLGTLVRLRDCPPAEIYTGGLDRNGEDGEFAYSWQDDICQGTFFVIDAAEVSSGIFCGHHKSSEIDYGVRTL